MPYLILGITTIIILFVLIRYNSLWVYKFVDRALKNDRITLPKGYELPVYYRLNARGIVDTSVPWNGWDGWYFFAVPDDENLPVKMIRASLMTGLYGLEGIDDYEKLMCRLSTFDAVEHLTLIPTEEVISERTEKRNHFSHNYLPKSTDLLMEHEELNVAIRGDKTRDDRGLTNYGHIEGSWPNYTVRFINPEAEISLTLSFAAESIVWWADIPKVFTYFATFGKIDGKVVYKRGTTRSRTNELTSGSEVYSIEGRGCLEHGFAYKAISFDCFWKPIGWLTRMIPTWRPIRYHYELLIGNDHLHGGFMLARGFGIDLRNRGGLYFNGSYTEIRNVEIDYLDDPAPDLMKTHCSAGPPAKFYRRWRVKAHTDEGVFEYTGRREWPPAAVASHMIYYNFSYKGTFRGTEISGRGYGEYLEM